MIFLFEIDEFALSSEQLNISQSVKLKSFSIKNLIAIAAFFRCMKFLDILFKDASYKPDNLNIINFLP